MRKTAIIATALGLVAAAHAQLPLSTPAGIRAGVFFPTDSRSRSLSTTWFAAGVDFRLPIPGISIPKTGVGAFAGLSVDYYERGGNKNIPVIASYNIRYDKLTYTAGLGPSFYRLQGHSDRIGMDFAAAITYDLISAPMPVFLQARYYHGPRDQLRGYAFMVGVRF